MYNLIVVVYEGTVKQWMLRYRSKWKVVMTTNSCKSLLSSPYPASNIREVMMELACCFVSTAPTLLSEFKECKCWLNFFNQRSGLAIFQRVIE